MLYGFCKFICKIPISLVYPTRVLNKKRLQKGIVICNHFAKMDVPVVGLKMPFQLSAVAKKELFEKRFIGGFLRRMGGIPMDRNAPSASSLREVVSRLKGGCSLLLFPEGTRNRAGGDMLALKQGAAMFSLMSGVQIVPVRLWRKPLPFRRNILAVGEPIAFEGGYSKDNLEALGVLMLERMKLLKQDIEMHLSRRKRRRAARKLEKAGVSQPETTGIGTDNGGGGSAE